MTNRSGYTDTVYPDKQSQAVKVQEILEANGFIPQELVPSEVAWFYENLGIDDTYFAMENAETIADHILSLYGAKIAEFTKHTGYLNVDLQKKSENSAVFIHSSPAGVSRRAGPQWERIIDEQYLNQSTVDRAFRLETYRSKGTASSHFPEQLRCYFLHRCDFVQPRPERNSPEYRNIRAVSDKTFLSKVSEHTLEIYQAVMDEALRRQGPVMEMYEVVGTQERRIVIAYRMGTTSNFFSALSDLYHFYGLYSSRKYVEQFSNDISIISIYLKPVPNSQAPPIELSIFQVLKEVSLIYVLPDNPFFMTGAEATHAVQEATYAYVGWLFAQHFCNRLGPAYEALRKILDESDSHQAAVLNDIKLRLREETFTRQSIYEVIQNFPNIVRLLYVHFANIHYPGQQDQDLAPTLSHQRLTRETLLSDDQMRDFIIKTANNSHERQVFLALLSFNKSVRKTNFYTSTKVALSFRLDCTYLFLTQPRSSPSRNTRLSPMASSLSSAPSSVVSMCVSPTWRAAVSALSAAGTARTTRSTSVLSLTRTTVWHTRSTSRTRTFLRAVPRVRSCPTWMRILSWCLRSTSMRFSTS